MKHLTTLILLLTLSTTVVSAQVMSPTAPTTVKEFLNAGASQSRQGWLGIGTFPTDKGPQATLDVRGGASLMQSLKVLGNAVIHNRLAIGGPWGNTTGNGLKVSDGMIRVSPLAGFNKKTLCIEPSGKLAICNTSETLHNDKCSNITGVQTTLPYTYYEQHTGRKIVVTAPNGSTTCTRTGESVKQCSDGFSNDTDGAADAADGNCYVPIMTNPVTNKPADPTLAAKFLATIGRPVLKIGSNWYVYDPLKDSETDGSSQVCGNNTIEAPEECDAGSSGSPTCGAPGTANACKMITAVCGNGVIEPPEQCDLGVDDNGNGYCSTTCQNVPLAITGFNCLPLNPNPQNVNAGLHIKCKIVLNKPAPVALSIMFDYWDLYGNQIVMHAANIPAGATVSPLWSINQSFVYPLGSPYSYGGSACYSGHTPSTVSLLTTDFSAGTYGSQITVAGNPDCQTL